MSRLGTLCVAGLLVLGGCSVPSLEDLQGERGPQLAIRYTDGFTKGCFRITIQDLTDSSRGDTFSLEPEANPGSQSGGSVLTVNALRKSGWGSRVKATVVVHEEPCDRNGMVVESDAVEFKLPSRETITMQFSTPDADNDGFISFANGGSDCADNDRERNIRLAEVCDDKDNNCRDGVDEGFDKVWYLDADSDGVPRGPDFILSCLAPGAKYVRNAGQPFDCDDDSWDVYPGNAERCDGIDNDCASINGVAIDENFPAKGASCELGCGVLQCAPDGASLQCSALAPDIYYLDDDGDGDGVATEIPNVNPKVVCQGAAPPASGYARNRSGDCDDKDPAANSLLPEACDAIDNNCSGDVSDEPTTCSGTLKDVVSYHLTSADQDWKTVSVGPGGYPVWVAGEGGKLAVRKSANAKFESFSYGDPTTPAPTDGSLPLNTNNCGNHDWLVSWVSSDGVVFLGAEAGFVAIHTGATGFNCEPGTPPVAANITGMVGFESGGLITLYLTDTDGRLIRWNVSRTPRFTALHDNNINHYGLHGVSENLLLVSGGSTGPDRQRFLSYAGASGATATPTGHTANPNDVVGKATAVWMGMASNACAVGEGGAVWRWDGTTTWNKVDPAGVTFDFTSVVMRYDAQNAANPLNRQCYMVDKGATGAGTGSGKLRRLTPFGWAKGPNLPPSRANVPLRDIAIADTGDLWIVGDDGRVFHYPEP
ncbi:putative metal-binding motif-containing protein [Corallococcus terminator]